MLRPPRAVNAYAEGSEQPSTTAQHRVPLAPMSTTKAVSILCAKLTAPAVVVWNTRENFPLLIAAAATALRSEAGVPSGSTMTTPRVPCAAPCGPRSCSLAASVLPSQYAHSCARPSPCSVWSDHTRCSRVEARCTIAAEPQILQKHQLTQFTGQLCADSLCRTLCRCWKEFWILGGRCNGRLKRTWRCSTCHSPFAVISPKINYT